MWEPLHLDEKVMLAYSRESLPGIVKDVFVKRGGAPAQFFVEHFTLSWPGGLVGLRGASLVFFLLALPAAAVFARRLVGERTAVLLALLLALSPLAVGLATFARMYALLLLCVLCTALLAIRAAERGDTGSWAVAGAAAGLLVYVHPIAPLYAPAAIAVGFASRDAWRPRARELRPALIAAGVVLVPYAYALAVLRSRYHVGQASTLSATAGRPVPVDSLYALAPGGGVTVAVFSLLALAGLVWLALRRPPLAVVLAAWILVPIAFFSVVPASTRFFGRYLVPALPVFLLLVIVGCFALAQVARMPVAAAVVVVIALLLVEGRSDVNRLRSLHALRLPELAAAVPRDAVLFSSTGSPRSDRPPELLDDYVVLKHPSSVRVEELPAIDPRYEEGLVAKGRTQVRGFLRAHPGPARGAWVVSGRPARVDAAVRRLRPRFDVERVAGGSAVVVSRRPASASHLVREGIAVRTAWGLGTPADRWPRVIVAVDRAALR